VQAKPPSDGYPYHVSVSRFFVRVSKQQKALLVAHPSPEFQVKDALPGALNFGKREES